MVALKPAHTETPPPATPPEMPPETHREPGTASASAADGGGRALGPALLRGWRGRCPNCGGGPMMSGYLRVRPSCASCSEELHHHRADDAPAWATILIVGHVLVSALLIVETRFAPPLWVHWAVWPVATLGLTMWLLPRVKGMIVALQWAWRMHGFDERPQPPG